LPDEERGVIRIRKNYRTTVTGDHHGAKRRRWASVLTAWLGALMG
jgi:hypothetical protein